MNKKIFTLLVGASLSIGSLFTASAQTSTPTVQFKVQGETSFADTLRADTAKYLNDGGAYYLLSITDIANPSTAVQGNQAFLDLMAKATPSKQLSYVMFVDEVGQLRMDTVAVLDKQAKNGGYGFDYEGSYKIGALRHASWCVNPTPTGNVTGSNVIFDFDNMATGEMLEAPLQTMRPDLWKADPDGQGRQIYKGTNGTINLVEDDELIVSGWHFSQTFDKDQELQKGMPLYSYVEKDSVIVMVLDDTTYQAPVDTLDTQRVGGWKVTVKYVAVNDLVKDEIGNVRLVTDNGKYVSNVLLFTLKKLEKFVLNADDYNAINKTISFDPDARNSNAANDGWNPFSKAVSGADPHGRGLLKAYEVNDSLYRYGYMQFQRVNADGETVTTGDNSGWLYVDTAFWNYGNDEFLKFAWSASRRENKVGGLEWGSLFKGVTGVAGKPDSTITEIYPLKSADPAFKSDSLNYLINYNADSIMENQSKFRVVYDPSVDSTFINVYQTRVRYTNYANPNNPEKPVWWTNSFALEPSTQIVGNEVTRPSDYWMITGNGANAGAFAAFNPITGNNLTDRGPARPRPVTTTTQNAIYFHTLLEYYPESAPKGMDKVMISTADTSVFFVHGQPLSHTYGWNAQTNGQGDFYKDSLFYVDIQNLDERELDGYRIATIDQAKIGNENRLDAKIGLGFGGCKVDNGGVIATIDNDLYLIRNAKGEYLSVPIYSVTDSVYWVTPKEGEDPTRMPSYQWAVENKRSQGTGSPFKLTNREFEHVSFDYVYVYESGDRQMRIGDPDFVNARFANNRFAIIRAGVVDKDDALKQGEFERADEFGLDQYSFLPLAKNVKEDQLLGYNYIDKDSTYVDVYAFKYLHFLGRGEDANYMGWNGYEDANDTAVYVRYNDYHDKLYFMLQEMPYGNIGSERLQITPASSDYASLYEKYGKKAENFVNSDSLVMEGFGYMPTVRNTTGKEVYDYASIKDLKPLARQAYRLLLKDYYKFAPSIQGDFMTVGQQDRYILADKLYATQPYTGQGRVEGVFGIPYFYFRNTYFDIEGVNKDGEDVVEDYFALVQRLDTIAFAEGHSGKFDDVIAYVKSVWGEAAAERIKRQVEGSDELAAFIATVGEEETELRITVRAESEVNIATFTLERDDDPLYRRFHWNDQFERTNDDSPLVLEFHRLNNEMVKLYENSGSDKGMTGGGYQYNVDNNGNQLKDSLGNIISFLGVKNEASFPSVTENDDPHASTNYAIYVDTAYINRGTGWIKPQYMLAVDVEEVIPCQTCVDPNVGVQNFRGYKIGRYLYNTSMYAKEVTPVGEAVNYDLVQPVNSEVIHKAINGVTGNAYTRDFNRTKWERLAFAWAIHRGDTLFVLKNVAPQYQGRNYDTQLVIEQLGKEYGGTATDGNVDFGALMASKGKTKAQLEAEGKTIGLHAMIVLDDNTHKDWVFSFRYIQRRADDFIIESETENRDRVNGTVIRPGYGGWVKYDNEVPIITRSEMHNNELLAEGDIMNVEKSTIDPVANDPVTEVSVAKVIGGNGEITVQNASGKTIVVSNILGQTVANMTLTSDNASIAVPAGIVIVAIEGESATKVLVK